MTPRRPNHRLRALLREADWTQEALAHAVNSMAREIGRPTRYDRTAVAHWLAGTQPRPPIPELAAEALSRRIGRPLTPQAAGFPPGPADSPPDEPADGFAALREGIPGSPGCPAGTPHRPYRVAETRLLPCPTAGPDGSSAHERAEGGFPDAVAFFAATFARHGGRHARSALAAYLADDVAPLLGPGRAREPRAATLVGAARLAFLLARMYEDDRFHGLAQRYYGYAHRLAVDAGDRVTWSQAVRAMSTQADRLGQFPTALRLAEAAARAVDGAPPGQRAYVYAQLAVARARCRDRRATLATLAAAERDVERAPDGGPFDRYPTAALSFQSGVALETLGDVPAALRCLRRSLLEREPTEVRGHALTRNRYAHLLLRSGHLDEACAAWRSFLDERRLVRSEEVERAARGMRHALEAFRNRGCAADLLARYDRSAPRPRPAGAA